MNLNIIRSSTCMAWKMSRFSTCFKHKLRKRDFRLPRRSRWELRSSGSLRRE